MSKRQEIIARRRRRAIQSRLFTVGLVVVGALLVAFAFIASANNQAGAQNEEVTVGPIMTAAPRTFSVPEDGPSVGNPDAPVRVDVWEDFQCPACASYSQSIEVQIITNYVEAGLVLYTFHFYPMIDGANNDHYISSQYGVGESDQAANAAMCASEQGRFWDYHDTLYLNWDGENQGGFADPRLLAFAEGLGLDMQAFNTCFEANLYQAEINADFLAGMALQISGTPSIFVNYQRVDNPAGLNYIPTYENIADAIEAALAVTP
ncbi:MAG: thioredoxin domain-containing protein [Anaerolineales bacterium]|nr:thioredoxin domain-containing protein [Anaerolineales bacterium]